MSEPNIFEIDSAQSDDCVDFLIITALPVERNAVLGQLPGKRKHQEADFPTYYRATLETDPTANQRNPVVAVTMLRHVGNVHAAVHTARCLQRLKPHFVLMVGIAGGVKDEVHLGDVVVSEEIIYYENTKEKPCLSDQRPQILQADWLLLDRAQNYTDNNWYSLIKSKRPANPRTAEVSKVSYGPIASGEKVIADSDRVSELKHLHSKLLAIEMESFGVALAASEWTNNPGFIAFRGICDYADYKKNDDWHAYAADCAAAFTIGLLRSDAISVSARTQPLICKVLIAIRHHSMEPLSKRMGEASLPETLKLARIVNIEIDQTDLYDNGRLTSPVDAVRRQRDIIHELSNALSTYPDAEVCYYGVAHIPLLFHIGCQVLTRVPLHFFDHNRITNEWDLLQNGEDYPRIISEGLPAVVNQKHGDIILRISISYFVTPEAIEGIVANPIASLQLRIDQPKIDAVTSKNQLEQYSIEFRDMLDDIRKKFPNAEYVHIFYAGPVALAVNFGRQISKTIHPRIIVYNYSSKDNPPGYAWGLEVTTDVESADFMTSVGG